MKHCYSIIATVFFSASLTAQIFDVDTIQYNGDSDTHINIVFLGDGYLESELDKFVTDATTVSNALFTEDPFSYYKNYFNCFLIKVASNASGAALDTDSPIDNYFGSTFGYAGIDRLLVPINYTNISNVLANNFPEYDQVFMSVNSSKYGGSGGWIATFSTHASAKELAFHELGHSFANLIDEYWAGDQYAQEGINMTQETDVEELRWKNWYGDNDIGLYPHSESPAWYRPHQNCKMRYLGKPFCSVCTEGIIERIHHMVSPLLSYKPLNREMNASDEIMSFAIDVIEPNPNTLKVEWKLNNSVYARNVDSVSVDLDELGLHTYILKVTIEDTTQLLRVDNHSSIHLSVVEWEVGESTIGIKDISTSTNEISIRLYPNPVQEYLTIDYLATLDRDLRVEIVDMLGRVLLSRELGREQHSSLFLGDLEDGYYLVRCWFGNEFVGVRKIKK